MHRHAAYFCYIKIILSFASNDTHDGYKQYVSFLMCVCVCGGGGGVGADCIFSTGDTLDMFNIATVLTVRLASQFL
jgi:hypothetical protein